MFSGIVISSDASVHLLGTMTLSYSGLFIAMPRIDISAYVPVVIGYRTRSPGTVMPRIVAPAIV